MRFGEWGWRGKAKAGELVLVGGNKAQRREAIAPD